MAAHGHARDAYGAARGLERLAECDNAKRRLSRLRDLIITENITVDGVIEATGGWFAPAGGESAMADLENALAEQRDAADALLLGKVTFEQMRGFWPDG
jgi:hypothetical protein